MSSQLIKFVIVIAMTERRSARPRHTAQQALELFQTIPSDNEDELSIYGDDSADSDYRDEETEEDIEEEDDDLQPAPSKRARRVDRQTTSPPPTPQPDLHTPAGDNGRTKDPTWKQVRQIINIPSLNSTRYR